MTKRITNNELMEAIMNLNNTLSSLEERVTKLESGSSSAKKNTSAKSAPKTSSKKSSAKSAPKSTKSSKVNLADFEPKKDADGHYNWASYKACRRRYVEEVSGKTLHGKDGEWLEGETFKKLAKPFEEAYKYVKKSDR